MAEEALRGSLGAAPLHRQGVGSELNRPCFAGSYPGRIVSASNPGRSEHKGCDSFLPCLGCSFWLLTQSGLSSGTGVPILFLPG